MIPACKDHYSLMEVFLRYYNPDLAGKEIKDLETLICLSHPLGPLEPTSVGLMHFQLSSSDNLLDEGDMGWW